MRYVLALVLCAVAAPVRAEQCNSNIQGTLATANRGYPLAAHDGRLLQCRPDIPWNAALRAIDADMQAVLSAVVAPGATTQVAYNDAGLLAGDANHTWNKSTKTLAVGQTGIADGTLTVACTPASSTCYDDIPDDAADPAAPAAGQTRLYAKSSRVWFRPPAGSSGQLVDASGALIDTMAHGSGTGLFDWLALPSGRTNGCAGTTDKVTYNSSTHTWGCAVDAQAGGTNSNYTEWPRPFDAGGSTSAFGSANITRCTPVVPYYTMLAATKMTISVNTIGGVGAHCGICVYDTAGTTLIATSGALDVHAGTGNVTKTGITAFDLNVGVLYNYCFTCDDTTVILNGINAATSTALRNVENAFVTRRGLGNNGAAGVCPATRGAITGADVNAMPALIMSVE